MSACDDDPPCFAAGCNPVGTIGWPPEPEPRQPHAVTLVCAAPDHQAHARAWVRGITGHEGAFRPFAEDGPPGERLRHAAVRQALGTEAGQ